MSESRFTAQEMREVAEGLVDSCVADNISILVGHGNLKVVKGDRIVAMLRQAADAENELAQLREENAKLTNIINTECNTCGDCARFGEGCTSGDVDGNEDCRACEKFVPKEVAQLKARLESVVKVAKEQFDIIFHSPMCWDEDENESHSLEQLEEMDALEMVVATARGEGGAK